MTKEGIERKIDVAAIRKKVDDIKTSTGARLTKKIQGSTADLNTRVGGQLSDAKSKINNSVGTAFDAIQGQLQDMANSHAKKAAAVNIPSKVCRIRNKGCWGGEESSSKKNRKIAQAKKDAESKQASKFQHAANQMTTKKANALAAVNQKLDSAGTDIANATTPTGKSVLETGAQTGATDTSGMYGDSSRTDESRAVKHQSSIEGLVKVDGVISDNLIVDGVINASIGDVTSVSQRIGVIDTSPGNLTINSFTSVDAVTGAVNAAIGYNTFAEQDVGSVISAGGNQVLGGVSILSTSDGALNAALGANTQATMRLVTIAGSADGQINSKSVITDPLNATLGSNTQSTMQLGYWQGDIRGSGNLFLQSAAALSASIGDQTTSLVGLANTGPNSVLQSLDMSVISEGSLAAPVGYASKAEVSLGEVLGSAGAAKMYVTTGPVLSASLGSNTSVVNRAGYLGEGNTIGGHYHSNVKTGALMAFALGDRTNSKNVIGSVQADIGGNADIDVSVGEVITGTVGENTEAETMVGSVLHDVSGDVDIDIVVGGINSFAIGLSTGKTIYSKTYVGNVLAPVSSANISVTSGSIFNLGFGLVLDLGIFGTLDLSRQGCVNIGNVGGNGC